VGWQPGGQVQEEVSQGAIGVPLGLPPEEMEGVPLVATACLPNPRSRFGMSLLYGACQRLPSLPH